MESHIGNILAQGSIPLLQWALGQGGYRPVSNTCAQSAAAGQLELLKWLRRNGCGWDEGTCTAAAKGGHVEVLAWARNEGCACDAAKVALAGTEAGSLEVVTYAVAQGLLASAEVMSMDLSAAAVRRGSMDVLQLLHTTAGFPLTLDSAIAALAGGHARMLDYIVPQLSPAHQLYVNITTTSDADVKMQLMEEALRIVDDDGDNAALYVAVAAGDAAAVRWFVENGVGDETACHTAAVARRMDILRLLESLGCPWDERTTEALCATGQFDGLVWAVKEKCPRFLQRVDDLTGDAATAAGMAGHIGMLRRMLDTYDDSEGYMLKNAVSGALISGRPGELRWLLDRNARVSAVVAQRVSHHIGEVRRVLETRDQRDTYALQSAVQAAVRMERPCQELQWLIYLYQNSQYPENPDVTNVVKRIEAASKEAM
ncbi:hypothetical protein JKP88DRAFT_304475 [Tribonema minus]|uniref:Uncharacterized protein n=1 Tax=Tribonema minus TaxID=303371 RepID=A0A835Z9T4_9STRA|nr:hypothetical protein JKP88DRAFT_304475 [Tribonema minus]